MLTFIQTVKQNTVFEKLSKEQLSALETLWTNYEDMLIKRKQSEAYDNVDKKIQEATGVKKQIGEFTSKYAQRAFGADGEKVKTLEGQIAALKGEKTSLEEKIKAGAGDETLKQTIKDKEKIISDLQEQVKSTVTEWEGKLSEANQANLQIGLDYQFEKAQTGIKFLSTIPDRAIKASIAAAKKQVLSKGKAEFFENATGEKSVRFRDENGMIINNPENLQNPFTLSELLTKELDQFGILDKGKKQGGAGTKGGSANPNGAVISVSGATTKTQATDLIKTSLAAEGISTNHPSYQAKFDEAFNTAEIQALPLR